MSEHPNSPAPSTARLKNLASQAVARLQQAGFTALWAGGCVRDILMGLPPKDYDIATDAPPDRVAALFPGSVLVGRAFGVVRAPVEGVYFEVATFRKDLSYQDGRRPEAVSFTDPPTDALRRDFTINAMFYDPSTSAVLDYVGGRRDLDRRVVRSVMTPEQCFADDHLRMLRAVRFTSVLQFSLDPSTADAIRGRATDILRISVERIREELARILTESPRPGNALLLLQDTGLLPVLLPEVSAMMGYAHPPEFHPEGDVFQHTVAALNVMGRTPPQADAVPVDDLPAFRRRLAFAVLLHDIGKPLTARETNGRIRYNGHAEAGAGLAQQIMTRYRFSNDDIQAVVHSVRNHMRFMNVREMRRATLLRLVGDPTFPMELELHRIDCLASHGDLANHAFLIDFVEALRGEKPLPAPWVSGHDIMRMGVPEGPQVGVWRKKAYEVQLEGSHPDRDSLLAWIASEIRAAGTHPNQA